MELQRLSARAILIHQGEVLLVRRQRLGDEYYVLPGGGIEADETPYDACRREVREETGRDVLGLRSVTTSRAMEQSTRIFWAMVESQEVRLGEIEAGRSSEENRYELVWVAAETVAELELRPAELKELVSKVAQMAAG
ncbi:MAG TPA: NUDIX domain-containing protein [Anaerolineales bacterium]|nr:NUDIX domain-containing protein [Anaerolineales bacterium]